MEVLDGEPLTVASGWEDIVEVSLVLPQGLAYFNEPSGSDVREVGSVAGEDAGGYRVRLHAEGRDADFDAVVDSSAERHLVQFWQAPPSAVEILALGSAAGKSLPGLIALWLVAGCWIRPGREAVTRVAASRCV